MEAPDAQLTHIVPDASLVVKWYETHEPGAGHAARFQSRLVDGTLRLTAPEHLKLEVARSLQLGVRDKQYSVEEGLIRVAAYLDLPINYVANDALVDLAFVMATRYFAALYDCLYLALAHLLDVPFVTADRRFMNLARQRGLRRVLWFEDALGPSDEE